MNIAYSLYLILDYSDEFHHLIINNADHKQFIISEIYTKERMLELLSKSKVQWLKLIPEEDIYSIDNKVDFLSNLEIDILYDDYSGSLEWPFETKPPLRLSTCYWS